MSERKSNMINNIEQKAIVFRIFLGKISFTYDGVFQLKLTIHVIGSHDKSGIRLRSKNSSKFIKDFSVKTEIVNFIKKQQFYMFTNSEYSFYLPKGFIKIAADFTVHMLIEIIQISIDGKSKVLSSSKIPIYPRLDVTINNNIEIGDPFYQFTGSLKLVQSENTALDKYYGNLFYRSEVCEIREIIENNGEPNSNTSNPVVNKRINVPEEKPNKIPKKIIEVSSLPFENKSNKNSNKISNLTKRKIIEFGVSPLPVAESPVQKDTIFPPRDANNEANTYNLLAPKNKEEITVFVHCGEHLLSLDNKPTSTYVSCSFKNIQNTTEDIYDSTHVTKESTSLPNWEEILNIPYEIGKLDKALSVTVIDKNTDQIIVEYVLPTKTLTPFIQYHLKLCQRTAEGDFKSVLYITLIRKLDHFPLSGKDVKYSAIIVKPVKFLFPRDENNNKCLMCFSYLSNDPTRIRKKFNSIEENMITVQFPSPSNFDYSNIKRPPMMSSGQLSIPSCIINGTDAFNFPFVFCQKTELDTSFTPHSFIVFDFYEASPVNGMNWRFNSPVMRTILELDKSLYLQLSSLERIYINNYDVQINDSLENDGKIILKKSKDGLDQKLIIKLFLTNQNNSDSIIPENVKEDIPQIPSHENRKQLLPKQKVKKEEKQDIKQKVKKEVKKEPFLYAINPIKDESNIDKLYIQNNLSPETAVDEIVAHFMQNGKKETAPRPKINLNTSKSINQIKESLNKMQSEVLSLRNEIKQIEMENQSLESKFQVKQSRNNMGDSQIQYLKSLSRDQLFNEYDKLRLKFIAKMSEISNQKEKEGHLAQSLDQQQSEASTLDILIKLQSKSDYLRKLEEDVIERENRIRSLEIMMDSNYDPIEAHKNKSSQVKRSDSEDNEREEIYLKLKKAENRITDLQDQLSEIARKRGSNRQMMKIKEKEENFISERQMRFIK